MTERCESCIEARAIHCQAIRALFRQEVGVIVESNNLESDFDDTKELGEQLEHRTEVFLGDMTDAGCTLNLPQLIETSADEMFAAGTLAGLDQITALEQGPELFQAMNAGFLEGIGEALDEMRDIIQASALASEGEGSSSSSFVSNLKAGYIFMETRDYCDERGWDPQSLTPEQTQEIEVYIKSLDLPY